MTFKEIATIVGIVYAVIGIICGLIYAQKMKRDNPIAQFFTVLMCVSVSIFIWPEFFGMWLTERGKQ